MQVDLRQQYCFFVVRSLRHYLSKRIGDRYATAKAMVPISDASLRDGQASAGLHSASG